MSRKITTASRVDELQRIRTLSRSVSAGYPVTAARYRREAATVDAWRLPKPRHLMRMAAKRLEAAEAVLERTRRVCLEWRANVQELAALAVRLLPELDGRLQHIATECAPWEEFTEADWAPILRELRMVEDASARAILSGAETSADTKADRKKKNMPRKAELLRLAKKLQREYPKEGTLLEIATDFCGGNERDAQSMLRGLRRYPALQLWKGTADK